MDCQLPGIDGYETTRRIRALEASGDLRSPSLPGIDVAGGPPPACPILALTASATREDLERARLSGMDDHIAKPVDARRLLDALAGHLGGPTGRARPAAPPRRPAADRVVDLARALDRVQGNRGLLDRMVAQFRAEVGETRGHLHDCLERRVGRRARVRGPPAPRAGAQPRRGQSSPSRSGSSRSTDRAAEWAASAAALQEVDREIDQVLDALAPGSGAFRVSYATRSGLERSTSVLARTHDAGMRTFSSRWRASC